MNATVQSIDTAREQRDIAEINALHSDIESGVQKAIRIGELLKFYKDQAGHGNWGDWLKANVKFSDVTAARYIRAYEGSKIEPGSNLPKTIKEAARAQSQRPAPAPEPEQPKPKFTGGWISAMVNFSGLQKQWGGSQAAMISEAVGYDIQNRKFTEAEAKEMAAQARLCFVEAEPLESFDLNKTEEKAVARAIRQEIAKIRREAQALLEAELKKRLAPKLKEYSDAIDAANKSKADYDNWAKDLPDWLTLHEFRILRGFFATDTKMNMSPEEIEKFNKASIIINKLAKRYKD